MEFVYSVKANKIICEHEERMYKSYLEVAKDYAPYFAKYDCTLNLGYEWYDFHNKHSSTHRPYFKSGYRYQIYCEVQRDGKIVSYKDNEGEVDYYELVCCWNISSITRAFYKLNVVLSSDMSDIKEDLNKFLSILESGTQGDGSSVSRSDG